MVLVILAILAAILVPALLGWIDESRKKQYVLDARSVYMATQAAVDEIYAKNPNNVPGNDEDDAISSGDLYLRIGDLSDVKFTSIQITSYAGREGNDASKKKGAEIDGMIIKGISGDTNVTATLVASDAKKAGSTDPDPNAGQWVITEGSE